jgi:hypothetical protein
VPERVVSCCAYPVFRRRRPRPHIALPIAVLSGLACWVSLGAASTRAPDQGRALKLLSSHQWSERDQGIQKLRSTPPNQLLPQVKTRLIDLLRAETERIWLRLEGKIPQPKHPGLTEEQYEEGDGEGFAEYYADLLGAVLRLRDPRSLPVVIQAAAQPSSVDLDIAQYGPRVIQLVSSNLQYLEQFRSPGSLSRGVAHQSQQAMADILTDIMKLDQQKKLKPPLTPSDYAEIRQMLRPLMASHDDYVRLYAARGLIQLGDYEDVAPIRGTLLHFLRSSIPGDRSAGLDWIISNIDKPALVPLSKVKELAESDPYYYREGVLGHGPVVYPVRQRAQKVLKKFSSR